MRELRQSRPASDPSTLEPGLEAIVTHERRMAGSARMAADAGGVAGG